jgi:hypothetical protein
LLSTTQAAATKAARDYKMTQVDIDKLKDIIALNAAAKKILGDYMLERKIGIFKGVTLHIVPSEGWDNAKLRAYLGNKVAEFRYPIGRKYFGLAKRSSQ